MKAKVLKTEQEYNHACARIYEFMHNDENLIQPDSTEGEELELLSLLVEKYEQEHNRMEAPDPIDAIQFRMEQMNLRQKDIAPLFGGRTRVSEVLNKKRPLTLRMIGLLYKYLDIPLESLIEGNRNIDLKPGDRKRILNAL